MALISLEVWDDSSRKVTFYTIKRDGETETETDKFLLQFHNDPKFGTNLQAIISLLLTEMGDRHGAQTPFFSRKENAASALPPPYARVSHIQFKYKKFPLRLYSLRISNSLVILFGGGIKSAATAQGSPDLAQKFLEANHCSKALKKDLKKGVILISPSGREFIDQLGNRTISITI